MIVTLPPTLACGIEKHNAANRGNGWGSRELQWAYSPHSPPLFHDVPEERLHITLTRNPNLATQA